MSYSSLLAANSTSIPSSATTTTSFGKKKSPSFLHNQPLVYVGKRVEKYISCQQKESRSNGSIDRRNMLLGMGGIYGATSATTGTDQGMSAMGAPFTPPDLTKCKDAVDAFTSEPLKCCPPDEFLSAEKVDFKLPSSDEPLRVRKPAHKFTPYEVSRFEAAIKAMKDLPENDPWNFYQQALIHCTYCSYAYFQAGTEINLTVHGSWFFLPWHRMYLYFWERILGKLIDEPTFTIPYWNWDTPQGMKMPEMYIKNEASPLYNGLRNVSHYDKVWDFAYSAEAPKDRPLDETHDVIMNNMRNINSAFKETKGASHLFMGTPLRAGQAAGDYYESSGSCERLHDVMHGWVGTTTKPFHDMGNFATAAKDTLFWAHHGNIDRLWDIYNKCRGGKPDFIDTDWLDSSFLFYDENRKLVKIKVSDVLTPEKLRYAYQPEELPWRNIDISDTDKANATNVEKEKEKKKEKDKKKTFGSMFGGLVDDMGDTASNVKNAVQDGAMNMMEDALELVEILPFPLLPQLIAAIMRALVKRPKVSRKHSDKKKETEVLIIKGLQWKDGNPGRLDVYLTKAENGKATNGHGQLAGSFLNIPHGGVSSSHDHHERKSNLQLGITSLLEEMDIEGSNNVAVTLVPRGGEVTVDGIEIQLVENNQ